MENSIEERLTALTYLQVLGSKLDEITRLRGSLPEEVNDLEDDLEGLETRLQRIDDEMKTLKEEIRNRTNKIEEFNIAIKKYEEQQNHVKNNREFEALRKEIEYAGLEILTSEKKIKTHSEQIQQKTELRERTAEQVAAKKVELEEKRRELEIITEETLQEERRVAAELESASQRVEKRILDGFNKIRSNMRNGLAVVTTDRDACGGCFSLIPPQVLIELKQKKRLIHCENCGRILVHDDLFEQAKEQLREKSH